MPIRIDNMPMKVETESSREAGQIIQRKLFDQPFPALEKGVDYRVRRNSLISSNIANLNTPNYRAFDLIMNEKLQEPKLVPTSTPVKNDGNSVDLDLEMSKLTENQLMFTTLTLMLSKRFEQLRTVIAEGRK
ncbi:MAG: flagellar basal body protein [bacterium]|nr:flagellar basal body protein [bacterium]